MNTDDKAADAYASAAERLRRRLLESVARLGRSQKAIAAARQTAEAGEPKLVAELAEAQLVSYLRPYYELASHLPPRKPTGTALARFDLPGRRGVVFPAVIKGAEFLQTRIGFTPAELVSLDADARAVAFTVARAQTVKAVEAVRDAIAEDIRQGGTLREFRANIADALEASPLGDAETETLYRTHVGRAYASGKAAVFEMPEVRSAVPYLRYVATHDTRVRDEHLALETLGLNGTGIYRSDDPIWRLFYPPWDWNCRCEVIPLSLKAAARAGVREAQEWLRTGKPPAVPEWVEIPDFPLPRGWVPVGRRLTPIG